MKRLIVFLIRRRLKLKKYQEFQFENQKDKDALYYFSEDGVMKISKSKVKRSDVSLKWLLDDDCKIVKRGVK